MTLIGVADENAPRATRAPERALTSRMTITIRYRDLQRHEAKLLGSIDRSERIDAIYRATDGILELEEMRQEVTSWDGGQLTAYIARLETVIDAGGHAFAAWDEQRLVGIGSLDTSGVGGKKTVLTLDMLYVSADYRGRGIGRRLTEMVASQARTLGATGLYISATPTRRTVDAYLRMGANVLRSPDPEMLAREPDDIHLVLRLTQLAPVKKETS